MLWGMLAHCKWAAALLGCACLLVGSEVRGQKKGQGTQKTQCDHFCRRWAPARIGGTRKPCPTFLALRSQGVDFHNSHSVFSDVLQPPMRRQLRPGTGWATQAISAT